MITDLILARREIEALKLENAHCHATCDELRAKLDQFDQLLVYAKEIRDSFEFGDTDDVLQSAGRLTDHFIEWQGGK